MIRPLFFLIWLKADGSHDAAFRTDGLLSVGNLSITQIDPQPDGTIYVAGVARGRLFGMTYEWVVLRRLNSDGSLDEAFIPTIYSPQRPSFFSRGNLGIMPNGQIVVGDAADDSFGLQRFNSDGSRDTNFVVQSGRTIQILPLEDGKLLAATRESTGAGVYRLHVDGTRDSGFAVQIDDYIARMAREGDSLTVADKSINGVAVTNIGRVNLQSGAAMANNN